MLIEDENVKVNKDNVDKNTNCLDKNETSNYNTAFSTPAANDSIWNNSENSVTSRKQSENISNKKTTT